ncbi:RAD52 motif-containing protein 1-like isoform X2 [Portunus trituberculatus]|uniref:RAD52 motif-containing protein 1-like isoform X2 n=1 Tax=Portunus trituberculatus TaxID=210409 RepID=UPI001E1CFDFC|nr:RAD52 motif-containing protein 1-like isoform X2 [Portunus trituberculatus]
MWQEIRKLFAQYGPIHRVTARREACGAEGDNVWYGYVAYFSAFDAEEVLRQSGKMIFGGRRIRLKKKNRLNGFENHGLSLHKSQELLMHYFGFNCWTSEIVYLERDDEEQKDSVRYICLVRVRMPKEGLCSEGLGLGEAPCTTQSPQGRGQSVACARRFAINSAMKAAFGKFVIIKLRNGKVTVEVDTTQTDLQMYDPLWDSTEVEVNDIDHDPEEEDSDEEFAMLQDIDDEELGALLDITISKDA